MKRQYLNSLFNRFLILLGAFFCITLSLPNQSLSALITTDMGNGADSYIQSVDRNTNYGSDDTIDIKHDSGTGFLNRKGYIRFDISSIDFPINDSALQLQFVENNGLPVSRTYNIFGLSDGHLGESWEELSITWNNAPANDLSSGAGIIGGEALFLGGLTIDLSQSLPGDSFEFKSIELNNFLNNDSNDLLTFIITRQERSLANQGFASKEHTLFSAPALNVSAVPLPATFWFLSFGLSLIGFMKKRE